MDAWAIWDPFFVAAQQQLGARVLTDAAGIVQRYQYFLSTRNFAEHHRDALDAVMDEVGKEGQRVRQDYGAAAAEVAPLQGLPAGIIEAGLRHYEHIYKPVDDAVLADQQRIADAFYELKLIPAKVSVHDATLPR